MRGWHSTPIITGDSKRPRFADLEKATHLKRSRGLQRHVTSRNFKHRGYERSYLGNPSEDATLTHITHYLNVDIELSIVAHLAGASPYTARLREVVVVVAKLGRGNCHCFTLPAVNIDRCTTR
jgi:hypothetical protein